MNDSSRVTIIEERLLARCMDAARSGVVTMSDDDLWDDVESVCVAMAVEGFRDLPVSTRRSVDRAYRAMARSSVDETRASVRDVMMRTLVRAHRAHPRDRVRMIRRSLGTLGVNEESAGPGAVRTLVRTHRAMVDNAAIWLRTIKDPAVWGYEYVTAEDERVRLAHAVLDGRRYPKRHRFWKRYCPPNGWNCRCRIRPVYYGDRDARTLPYRGRPDVDPEFGWNPGIVIGSLATKFR